MVDSDDCVVDLDDSIMDLDVWVMEMVDLDHFVVFLFLSSS